MNPPNPRQAQSASTLYLLDRKPDVERNVVDATPSVTRATSLPLPTSEGRCLREPTQAPEYGVSLGSQSSRRLVPI